MPLEIRELVIRASVNETGQYQNVNSGNNTRSSFKVDSQAEIITQCVEKVLAILKEKSER